MVYNMREFNLAGKRKEQDLHTPTRWDFLKIQYDFKMCRMLCKAEHHLYKFKITKTLLFTADE